MADASMPPLQKAMAESTVVENSSTSHNHPAEPQKLSKNAAKKAAKHQKPAAQGDSKPSRGNPGDAFKAEAKKAHSKAPKKKVEGAALIGIDVSKEEDFASWYQQVLTKGDMLDYYDVSGCYILKVPLITT